MATIDMPWLPNSRS